MFLYCSYRVNVKSKNDIRDDENVEMKAEIKNLKVRPDDVIYIIGMYMKSSANGMEIKT